MVFNIFTAERMDINDRYAMIICKNQCVMDTL